MSSCSRRHSAKRMRKGKASFMARTPPPPDDNKTSITTTASISQLLTLPDAFLVEVFRSSSKLTLCVLWKVCRRFRIIQTTYPSLIWSQYCPNGLALEGLTMRETSLLHDFTLQCKTCSQIVPKTFVLSNVCVACASNEAFLTFPLAELVFGVSKEHLKALPFKRQVLPGNCGRCSFDAVPISAVRIISGDVNKNITRMLDGEIRRWMILALKEVDWLKRRKYCQFLRVDEDFAGSHFGSACTWSEVREQATRRFSEAVRSKYKEATVDDLLKVVGQPLEYLWSDDDIHLPRLTDLPDEQLCLYRHQLERDLHEMLPSALITTPISVMSGSKRMQLSLIELAINFAAAPHSYVYFVLLNNRQDSAYNCFIAVLASSFLTNHDDPIMVRGLQWLLKNPPAMLYTSIRMCLNRDIPVHCESIPVSIQDRIIEVLLDICTSVRRRQPNAGEMLWITELTPVFGKISSAMINPAHDITAHEPALEQSTSNRRMLIASKKEEIGRLQKLDMDLGLLGDRFLKETNVRVRERMMTSWQTLQERMDLWPEIAIRTLAQLLSQDVLATKCSRVVPRRCSVQPYIDSTCPELPQRQRHAIAQLCQTLVDTAWKVAPAPATCIKVYGNVGCTCQEVSQEHEYEGNEENHP